KTLAYPLARITGTLDRRAWKTKPGDVFVLNWPDLDIEAVVFRVVTVRYGGLDKNTVRIEAVEDIFSISDVAYVQPPASGWVNPLVPPQQLALEYATDMPFALEPVEGSTVATFRYRRNGLDEGYAIMSDRASPYMDYMEEGRQTTFTPYGVTAAALPATDEAVLEDGFVLTVLQGKPDADSTEFALIVSTAGEEWIA